ncbi:ATP-binding protein [Bittarella massiliensis (ex Durand et al. 2017)]|uniref:AAA family ATPase n=1 Tax=Bittarella massiliensis (ex Durand et al. 2017) TaxID=1720313 RepID=A0AAW5KBG9_9FIRM|nr:AAA family ATPase [Bittarella massiliensis (ex Durand et al. 2017)]MCQ4949350.1 AAA family ATPase [Bittarella massiliensis (ex Durand et al. 2017)]
MAILQPAEMDFSNQKFSMIISGSPGIGKTTLALSAPDPVLIDFDKGVARVRAAHRKTTIEADTYEEVLKDLESPQVKACQTIVIDTGGSFVTYLQDWAMRDNPSLNRQKNGAISLKGFGAVKAEFVRFTNWLKYTLNKNIIYVFHTVEQRDGDVTRQRLLCEGAARDIVWQPCDLGCFMQMVGEDRLVGFTPTEQYFAKGCYGVQGLLKLPRLDDGVPNDFLSRLFERARENIRQEAEAHRGEQEAYEAAMEQARDLIEGIRDPATALETAHQLKKLSHHLTSEREAKALLAAKIKALGMHWDREAGAYVKE